MLQIVRKFVTKPMHKLYTLCPHIEHTSVVTLAGSEVFHLGQFLFIINVVLLVTGAAAVMYESFHLFGEV